MKSVPVIVRRVAAVQAARVTQVRLINAVAMTISKHLNHKPNCAYAKVKHAEGFKLEDDKHSEAHKVDKFLPEFPHNAPHWGLSDRMSEPTKATLSPQWRPPHPNRKKAEYQ